MTIVKSTPYQKYFRGNLIITSDHVIVSEPEYSTGHESYILVKGTPTCKIKLDSTNTEHITIKALTTVLIVPDVNYIDEEFDEVLLEKGASIELVFSFGGWYITSSDGLKLN